MRDIIFCNRGGENAIFTASGIIRLSRWQSNQRETVMDKKKKKIIVIIIATIVSLVTSIAGCLLGIPNDAFDTALTSTEIVEILDTDEIPQ